MRYYTGSNVIKWSGDGKIEWIGAECPCDIIEWAITNVVGVEDVDDVECVVEYSYTAEEWEPADSFPDFDINVIIDNVFINGFGCPKNLLEANTKTFEEEISYYICDKHHLED